jgi:hypothetical protein
VQVWGGTRRRAALHAEHRRNADLHRTCNGSWQLIGNLIHDQTSKIVHELGDGAGRSWHTTAAPVMLARRSALIGQLF